MVDAADLKSVEPYKLVRVQVSPPPSKTTQKPIKTTIVVGVDGQCFNIDEQLLTQNLGKYWEKS